MVILLKIKRRDIFFNEAVFLFCCYALWKIESSNCCIFDMKHATGMETCTKIYFLFIFNLQGPRSSFLSVGTGEHLFWIGAGVGRGKFGCSLCLELSDCWTLVESLSTGVMFINFKPLKSTFLLLSLIALAGSTSRSLQIMILHCNVIEMRQRPHHRPI